MQDSDTPIILIPGFMLDETLWDPFIDAFQQKRAFTCVNLTVGNTISEIAKLLADTLPEKFILVGFSLGGYVARAVYEQYPERVAGLVLIATSLREDTPQQAATKRTASEVALRGDFNGLSSVAIKRSLHESRADDHQLINKIRKMGQELGKEVFYRQSLLVRENITRRPVERPTLVIAAREDRLRSLEEANEIIALIPQAQLKIIAGSGHMLPLENPGELAGLVEEWLEKASV